MEIYAYLVVATMGDWSSGRTMRHGELFVELGFNANAALVACKQLGYNGGYAEYYYHG